MTKLENGYHIDSVSEHGLDNGYCDYRSLSNRLDAMILNNDIFKAGDFEAWNPIDEDLIYSIGENNREEEEEEVEFYDTYLDILEDTYQWYMVNHRDAMVLTDFQQVVIYNEDLNVYLWCVGHFGTSWDYVLTNIKIESV